MSSLASIVQIFFAIYLASAFEGAFKKLFWSKNIYKTVENQINKLTLGEKNKKQIVEIFNEKISTIRDIASTRSISRNLYFACLCLIILIAEYKHCFDYTHCNFSTLHILIIFNLILFLCSVFTRLIGYRIYTIAIIINFTLYFALHNFNISSINCYITNGDYIILTLFAPIIIDIINIIFHKLFTTEYIAQIVYNSYIAYITQQNNNDDTSDNCSETEDTIIPEESLVKKIEEQLEEVNIISIINDVKIGYLIGCIFNKHKKTPCDIANYVNLNQTVKTTEANQEPQTDHPTANEIGLNNNNDVEID